jgi:hypothetical protein
VVVRVCGLSGSDGDSGKSSAYGCRMNTNLHLGSRSSSTAVFSAGTMPRLNLYNANPIAPTKSMDCAAELPAIENTTT